ncbi:hypothetical protein [Streptomyces boncukensis]|uniref:Uncharacterized protein n=1 Tax=Streptomyces boncukensis TaxID=2711219 RepID=A0A6G4WVL9_9ACTN|nr:hypothetical protein [Streptomyces boncukensis]NGO69158.1 hypothetical protein [Streptomyces boncukensis]
MDLKNLALREAALKTLLDAVSGQLKDVRAEMQDALDTTGASRVDAVLPDGTKVATVSRSAPKPCAEVVDDDLFLKWVREHAPSEITSRVVTEVRPAYQAQLLAEMTAAGVAEVADRETGVVHEVPGVEVRATRARGHSVRPVDGGADAIADAWRAGQLGHLDLPQLGAGGAS